MCPQERFCSQSTLINSKNSHCVKVYIEVHFWWQHLHALRAILFLAIQVPVSDLGWLISSYFGSFLAITLQVSWIKKARHPVVMSSGTAVFTSDRRVQIKTRSDTWILQIDPVLQKDDGFYECQVNTRKTMSLVFKLNVERK